MMKKILILALIFISFMSCAYAETVLWVTDEDGSKITSEEGKDIIVGESTHGGYVRLKEVGLEPLLNAEEEITFILENASFNKAPRILAAKMPGSEVDVETGKFDFVLIDQDVECKNALTYKLKERAESEYEEEFVDILLELEDIKAINKGDIFLKVIGDTAAKYGITDERVFLGKADEKSYEMKLGKEEKYEKLPSVVKEELKNGYYEIKNPYLSVRYYPGFFTSGIMSDYYSDGGFNLLTILEELKEKKVVNESFSDEIGERIYKIKNIKRDRLGNYQDEEILDCSNVDMVFKVKAFTFNIRDLDIIYGVEYIKDENGSYTKKLVPATRYDAANTQFLIDIDHPGIYSLEKINNLNKIAMRINDPLAKNNLNVERLDVSPMIIEGRTYVPIRYIAEKLGATVEFNSANRTVEIKTNSTVITLPIDKVTPDLSTPARIIDGRTLVPVRYVSEQLGAYVTWFAETQKIEILKIG